MMNEDKVGRLVALVAGAQRNALRTRRSRKRFAAAMCEALGLWEPPVYEFVEEMDGLNFYSAEDRILFIQFAMCAF